MRAGFRYEQKYKERVLNNMKAKAKQLGYEIALKPLAGSEVSQKLIFPPTSEFRGNMPQNNRNVKQYYE